MTPTASGLEPPEEEQEAAEALSKKQGVIFVLENASLETAKVGKVILHALSSAFGGMHADACM